MQHKRPEAGDHENTAFETVDPAAHHVKPGFHASEDASAKEGEERYPHRRSEAEVPKGPLAGRLRRSHPRSE